MGHLEVVKYLCESGVSFGEGDINAIIWASMYGHYEIVKYLYEAGADISKISEKHKRILTFSEKMKKKIKERAQKKIYFWWIPICYDVSHPSGCGKRMMLKNLEKARELGLELN
jgi:hypothetical protein